jgi:cation-transporting ATPase 13A1
MERICKCMNFPTESRFDIPIPTFAELFKEQALAPFFIFQLFCVSLWFLDEMWYYSIFTVMMLVVFESTVVFQRLKNLNEFRGMWTILILGMSIAPYSIFVYRAGAWTSIQTDELLPGDIVSILRSGAESPVACDIIILSGSCIANEAMLSGESTPQLKESFLEAYDGAHVFDMESDKNSVLFGGTRVLQVTPPENSSISAPPDKGCIGYVLCTGFSSQQGALVRTIVFSTERVTANTLESLFFILFLLFFALIAASYVWFEGIGNPKRKQSKVLYAN